MYTDRARNKFLNVAYYRWKWPILRFYKVSKARSSHPFPEESICKEIKFYFPLLNSILSPYVSRYSNSNRFDYYGIDGPFSSSTRPRTGKSSCSSRDGTRCLETRGHCSGAKCSHPPTWAGAGGGEGRSKGTASENSTRLSPFDLIGGFETNGGGRLRRLKWRFGHGRGLRSWKLVNGPCETIDPSSRDSRLFFFISLVKCTGI